MQQLKLLFSGFSATKHVTYSLLRARPDCKSCQAKCLGMLVSASHFSLGSSNLHWGPGFDKAVAAKVCHKFLYLIFFHSYLIIFLVKKLQM